MKRKDAPTFARCTLGTCKNCGYERYMPSNGYLSRQECPGCIIEAWQGAAIEMPEKFRSVIDSPRSML